MSPDQLELLGVDPLQDALAFTLKNPPAWRAIVRWAKEDVAAGIRPSVDCYGHVLRRPHMARLLGLVPMNDEPILFNNDLTASLGRLLEREYGIPCGTRRRRADSWETPAPAEEEGEETFDGLRACPVCATTLAQVDENDTGVWSGICWPCNRVWRWDSEGYWEGHLKEAKT